MNFEGKVLSIGEQEKVGANETPKISFVLEEVGKEYPSSICLDAWKDKIERVTRMTVGDVVKVQINSKAREYNGKNYNSLSAWKFDMVGEKKEEVEEKDDLPFSKKMSNL